MHICLNHELRIHKKRTLLGNRTVTNDLVFSMWSGPRAHSNRDACNNTLLKGLFSMQSALKQHESILQQLKELPAEASLKGRDRGSRGTFAAGYR